MDSAVSLALMRKAQLVFETADTFLSFPPTALAYRADDFDFLRGEISPEKVVALREFSQQVDQVARGPIAPVADEGRLSEVYGEVLQTARLAVSSRTAAEEADYLAALEVLYHMSANGGRRDSPKLTAYKQYRDAWFRAREEYNNRKIDAQYSEDPAVRERWNTVDEPLLRQLVEDAERDWRAKGYKEEVERARGVEETLGAKNPARIWEEWKTRLNPDLDQLTDPSTNQTFLPSAFSPSNILDASSWSKFTLDGQAVRALAEDAPASLRGRLGDQADVDIESLSFEFASLRVERSWFVPDVFEARFWKLPEGAPEVSAGDEAARGSCPAYIAALVVARRLTMVLKPQSERNAKTLQLLRTKALALGAFKIAKTPPPAPAPAGAQRRRVVLATERPLHPRLLGSRAAATPAAAARPPVVLGRRAEVRAAERAAARPATVARPAAIGRLKAVTFTAPSATLGMMASTAATAASGGSTPPQRAPSPQVDDGVYVLAFICKRVPRSPNPDPGLQW